MAPSTHTATPANVLRASPDALRLTVNFAVGFALESLVFLILPLSGHFPRPSLLVFQGALVCALFVAAQMCRRSEGARHYWPVLHALFVGALAVFLSTHFSDRLVEGLPFTAASPAWIAVAKLAESLWRVTPTLLLVGLSGDDLRSVYLSGGRVRYGLSVGMIGFAALATVAFLPLATRGGAAALISLAPWILLFVLANGFTEELLFRGLFLRRFERFLGGPLANLLTALVFTLLHAGANDGGGGVMMLATLFPLALAWGWLMQKSDSLWGSALFHAGADCLLIVGLYSKA
jgi:membrane protease YdiL (CAAX protease family)